MAVFVSSSGASQQSGQVTAYQVGQSSPSLPFYFGGGQASEPTTKSFPVPLPSVPEDPFSPIPSTPEQEPTMSRCGSGNATASLPAGSGIISANPLGAEEINVTPGIVTTAERAAEAKRAAEQAQRAEQPDSLNALLERFGLQDCPPVLLLVILVLTFAALRR